MDDFIIKYKKDIDSQNWMNLVILDLFSYLDDYSLSDTFYQNKYDQILSLVYTSLPNRYIIYCQKVIEIPNLFY